VYVYLGRMCVALYILCIDTARINYRIPSGIWSRLYGLLTQSKMWAPWKSGPKFFKIFQGMLLHKTPNHAKFCGDRLKNVLRYPQSKMCAPEKVGQSSPKSLKTCKPLRPSSCQILSRSVNEAWRKALQKLGIGQIFLSRTDRNVTTCT